MNYVMGRYTQSVSISIPPDLLEKAHLRMKELSVRKFSQYLQLLIERDVSDGGSLSVTRTLGVKNPRFPQPESVQAVSMAAESKGEYRVRRKKTA